MMVAGEVSGKFAGDFVCSRESDRTSRHRKHCLHNSPLPTFRVIEAFGLAIT